MSNPLLIEPLDLSAVWAATPPKLDFVLPGLVVGTLGIVVAAGGTGKTVAMLATSLSAAIGRDVGNLWGKEVERGPAVFVSLEDPEVILRHRLHALLPKLSEAERALACTNLKIFACAGYRLSIATLNETQPESTPWFETLSAYLVKTRPRLCVIDTFNRALGGISENDGGALGLLIGRLEQLAREANCAVVLCHHISKHALSTSYASEAHAARGSSVITDNSRWQINLSMPSDKDRQFATKSEQERRNFVRLSFSKQNYAAPIVARWLRRGPDGFLEFIQEAATDSGEEASDADAGAVVELSKRKAPKKRNAKKPSLSNVELEVA